jgi:hypothetical protein
MSVKVKRCLERPVFIKLPDMDVVRATIAMAICSDNNPALLSFGATTTQTHHFLGRARTQDQICILPSFKFLADDFILHRLLQAPLWSWKKMLNSFRGNGRK